MRGGAHSQRDLNLLGQWDAGVDGIDCGMNMDGEGGEHAAKLASPPRNRKGWHGRVQLDSFNILSETGLESGSVIARKPRITMCRRIMKNLLLTTV